MARIEPRRIIKFGKSSHIISLPKDWIDKNGLKKGEIVYVEEENNFLKIIPKERKNEVIEEKKTIDIENKSLDEVNRRLISAYLNNYSEITLKGKNDIVRKNVSILMDKIGIEIVEQTQNEIIIKDFLSIEGIAIDKIVRRMDNMIRSLFEDVRNGLQEKVFREEIYKEMFKVDKNINKIYFLIWKLVRKGQKMPHVFIEKLNLQPEELSNIQWLVINLEAIADEVKRVAKFLINENISKDKEEFAKIIELIEKNYTDIMTAYYSKDSELALRVISRKDQIMKSCLNLAAKKSFYKFGAICERLKTMEGSIHHISKIVAY